MAKNPKYPIQDLSEEDIEILDKAVMNYAVLLYDLIQQYHDPKRYAEEIVKMVRKAGNIAGVLTATYTRNIPNGYQFRPGELNQKLALDIENVMQEQYESLAGRVQCYESKKLLHPRDITGVLKKLEEMGIFIHLKTKEEILNHQIARPHVDKGNSAAKILGERGGKLSSYVIAAEVQRLKVALKKPCSIDYLNKKLIKSDLVSKLYRFIILAFLHAAKKDRKVLDMAIGVGTTFFQESQNRTEVDNFFQQLQCLDDILLENAINSKIKSIIEDHDFYAILYFTGLVNLLPS
jgi:hypothetical protein